MSAIDRVTRLVKRAFAFTTASKPSVLNVEAYESKATQDALFMRSAPGPKLQDPKGDDFVPEPGASILDAGAPERDPEPDTPRLHILPHSWICVPASSAEEVVDALSLVEAAPANWSTGSDWLRWVIQQRSAESLHPTFVTPPIDGWVFALGPAPLDIYIGQPLLEALSDRFGKACFFMENAVTDTYGWAKAEAGVLQRWFLYAQGEIIEKYGAETTEEHAIGLGQVNSFVELMRHEERPEGVRPINESDPDMLAHEWSRSVFPLLQGQIETDGVGIAGLYQERSFATYFDPSPNVITRGLI